MKRDFAGCTARGIVAALFPMPDELP
jgi:hypothetical protein